MKSDIKHRKKLNMSRFLLLVLMGSVLFPFYNPAVQAAESEAGQEPVLTVVTVNSHCDWAWIHTRAWHEARYAEAIRSYLMIMREYPDYVCQMETVNEQILPFLAKVQRDWPGLAEEFWQRVREGRIEIIVGYSNPRISEIYPETFVRNLVLGKEYFRRHAPGLQQKVYSTIDVMSGHSQMPQLLSQADYPYYEFQRKDGPQRTFWYTGLDGTRMLYSRNFSIAGNPELPPPPQEFNQVVDGIQPVPVWRVGLGMDDAMPSAEVAKLAAAWDPKKKILGTMARYFTECEKYGGQLSELEGPLDSLCYFANAGAYGSYNIYTQNNRNEDLLLMLEKAQVMAALQGRQFVEEPVQPLWQDLLSCSGHAIDWLFREDYEERMSLINSTAARARRFLEEALSSVSCAVSFDKQAGTPLLVFNFQSWPVSGPVEFYVDEKVDNLILTDTAGQKIPMQFIRHEPANGNCLAFLAEQIPACGYQTFYLRRGEEKNTADPMADNRSLVIENTWYRLRMSPEGKLEIYDKTKNEILAQDQNGSFGDLAIYDLPPSANWEHDGPVGSRRDWQVDITRCESFTGPVYAALRAHGSIGPHEILREVRLWQNSRRIEYLVEIDAKEDNGVFCVRFPVGDADQAAAGIPFGVESRDNLAAEPFRGTFFTDGYPEGYYATRWTDISSADYGYTFICPPGMHTGYLFQRQSHSLEFILLHLRTMPVDVFRSCHPLLQGTGHHTWRFALVPHEGSWQQALSYRQALEQQVPLLAYSPWYNLSRGGVSAEAVPSRLTGPPAYFGTLPLQLEQAAAQTMNSFVSVSPANVVLSSMRLIPSHDEARKPQYELRLYETTGQPADVTIQFAGEMNQVQQVNLLGEAMDSTGNIEIAGKEIRFAIQPWKIVTLRVSPNDTNVSSHNPDAETAPLFEEDRPDWELKFSDVNPRVLSVMPGESDKVFYDPIIKREVKWEQDVYCPTFSVFDNKLYCVYRSFGDDQQWRMGLAWSEDGLHFTRGDQPVFHARPQDEFLGSLRDLKVASISYGDSRLFVDGGGTYYLLFNYFSHGHVNAQELAVASTRDMKNWTVHGRIFAKKAPRDMDVIPEAAPGRFPHPAVVTRLEGNRLVVTKINGKYWMYLNCLATKGPHSLCMATSENMIDWEVVRDENGQLRHPMPLRPGYFDSLYLDTAAAVLRKDGILLIYNGINDDPKGNGDLRRMLYAHYPAQALFDRDQPYQLLQRSTSPFKGGDAELEKQPIVFCNMPLYESWSLVPLQDELLLYWNHGFGRRSVGLWKSPIPNNMK